MKTIGIFLCIFLLCGTITPLQAQGYGYPNQRYPNNGPAGDSILLDSVKALTFSTGKYTTGRRSAPIPQLQCIGGYCNQYAPSSIQCKNVGSDGIDVQWECKADLDSSVRFGKTEVSCEGYGYPEDPYILRGSCGLEYTLEPTEQGRNQFGSHGSYNYGTYHASSSTSSWGSVIMFIIIGLILVGLLRSCTQRQHHPSSYPTGPNSPGGYPGGGYPGGPGNYGSPPPYNPGYGPSYSSPSSGPGFWSGFTAGGVLGSLFRPRTPSYYGASPYRSYSTYGSSPSYRSPSTPRSSPRTATGFSSTRRR